MGALDIEEVADRLWVSLTGGSPLSPITDEYPEMSIEDAYRISEINLNRRIEERGTKLSGKKIGLTSKAVQTWLNVDQPDFGYLTEDMAHENESGIDTGIFQQPRIEAEIAFLLKKDLTGPGVTKEKVLSATESVIPALEIIDSRVKDWKIKIQDTVADNASSGAYVIGEGMGNPLELDLTILGMRMFKNGKIVSTGAGAACLGHPAEAVAWLANALGAFGVSLHAGETILSGALGPVTDIQIGDRICAEINGLGRVACHFN